MKRLAFWVVFLSVSGALFVHQWKTKDPLNNHPVILEQWARHNIRLLAHPHPQVAADAWVTLWNLFHRKWQIYHLLPAHFSDTSPIHFLVDRRSFPATGGQTALEAFFAEPKPIYYRSERIYCRTVGEALMAMMYREGKWKIDYQDDWNAWWELNRTYYRL
jgi:hypothetical protein